MNLLQVDSQINLEPEADLALDFLARQFPTDYEQDKPQVKKEPVLSDEEKLKKE